MDLVLVSDNKTLIRELEPLLREAVGGELVVVSGQNLLSGTSLPPADVVLTDQQTWQKYYSMFRFYGLLHYFDRFTMVSVVRGRRDAELKGRYSRKDLALHLPASTDVTRRVLDDARELSEQRVAEHY